MFTLLLVPLLASALAVGHICQSFDLRQTFPAAIRGEAHAFGALETAAIAQVLENHPDWAVCYVAPSECPVTPEIVTSSVYDAMQRLYTSCLHVKHDL